MPTRDSTVDKKLRVLFLYGNERSTGYAAVLSGKNHGGGFWGMAHLGGEGIEANFIEPEQYLGQHVARLMRRIVPPYFIHIFFYPLFFKYDVVYTSTAFGTQLLHTLYPFRKPRWVMHDFNITSFIKDRRTWKQKLFYFMVSRCDGIITLGREEATKLKTMFPHLEPRIQFLPFGVDINFFKPCSDTRNRAVFAVGRDLDRDWETLLKIAPLVDAPVVIATWEKRITRFRPLPPNVTTGEFSTDELRRLYAESAVFVLPLNVSRGLNDAMGCSALFEALAMGKAVVVTRTHTIASYINDGVNGFLVPEGDPERLRDAIMRILNDDSLRRILERNARTYAEEELDIHLATKKLAAYFERIVRTS